MDVAKLKGKYEQLQVIAFVLSVGMIIRSSLGWFKPGLLLFLIALAALVAFKRSYLGALGLIFISLIIFCIPQFGGEINKISFQTISCKVYLPYLIVIILYLETMSRLRIAHYLYGKYGSSGFYSYGLEEAHRGKGGEGAVLKEIFYRLGVFSLIYFVLVLIYNLLIGPHQL